MTDRDVHCPKCRRILRKLENSDSKKIGYDLYCDHCKDIMMTIIE